MKVVLVRLGETNWILESKTLKSLLELSQRDGLKITKGNIPSAQSKSCIGLEVLVRILNGGKAKQQGFEFTPEEWDDDYPPLELWHTNNRERAKAIRKYVRSMFVQGHTISVKALSGLYSGISPHTLRKHIKSVCEEVEKSEGLTVERVNNYYVPKGR